jgi:putative endonuclease
MIKLGQKGEKIAARYLRKSGYRVLVQGYRSNGCEVDLVVHDKNGDLVFVEVKTRQSVRSGYPEEAVTDIKRMHIERAATGWIQENSHDGPWRVDVIAITIGEETELVHFIGV